MTLCALCRSGLEGLNNGMMASMPGPAAVGCGGTGASGASACRRRGCLGVGPHLPDRAACYGRGGLLSKYYTAGMQRFLFPPNALHVQ